MFKCKHPLFAHSSSEYETDYTQWSVIDPRIPSTPEQAIIMLYQGPQHIELFIEYGSGDEKCIERYYVGHIQHYQWTKQKYAYKSEPIPGQPSVYQFTYILNDIAIAKETATSSKLFNISKTKCQTFLASLQDTTKFNKTHTASPLILGSLLSIVHSSCPYILQPEHIEHAFNSIGESMFTEKTDVGMAN